MTLLVWAYSESDEAANELSTAANEIANAASGQSVELEVGAPRTGVAAGSKLVLKTSSQPPYAPEIVSEMIFRASEKFKPSVILVGSTRQGREVAARLAAKLGAGSLSDAFGLNVSGQMLVCDRNAYAGRVLARMSAPMPCVATVRAGSYPANTDSESSMQEFDPGEVVTSVKVLRTTRKEVGKVDLRKAKTIVAVGRGMKRKEDVTLIEGLASSLGAAVGCSRPISSDLGWLPEECHVGLTGVSVSPELYLAIGISGQLQHVAGIKDSKVIAAINSDKDAPIFQAADYGVVGDLYQVVPALQKLLSARIR
ncbi:MAG TPA: electron transfer flavoprotein subunit alpha/FixB family protein [Nitrososphaerales archaeon]|nr:electron transfer flavoprotein subunit alpha/FixB family protein [Nitrososphaerales archaeon]